MLSLDAYRILIADVDSLLNQQIKTFLESKGFVVVLVNTASEMKRNVAEWKPHFLVVDMLFPEVNGLQALKWIQSIPGLRHEVKVVITSNHNTIANVRACITAGAVDYWVKPIDPETVASRIVFQLSRKNIGALEGDETLEEVTYTGPALQFYLADIMFREAQRVRTSEETTFNITKMLALNLKSVRVSVMACDQEAQLGWVVASSDDMKVSGLKLNLARYPEVNHVLITEKMAVIENLDYDPRLQQIKDNVKSISFNSMIVCPVFKKGSLFGVMSTRMGLEHKTFNDLQIRFARLVSVAAGFVLERDVRNAHEFARVEEKKAS